MKVTVKLSDVERIVRRAFNMDASDEFDLVVDADNSCGCGGNTGWYSVPSDWSNPWFPPDRLLGSEEIQVRYRNGELRHGIASSWTNNWCQEDHKWDIVEYRIMQSSGIVKLINRLICWVKGHDRQYWTRKQCEAVDVLSGLYAPYVCRRCGHKSDLFPMREN